MESYQIRFSDVSLKNMKRFPKQDQKMILKNIQELADDPIRKSNVKRLVSYDVAYRLRVGHYRILFEREDVLRIIDVVNILHRKESYQRRS